MPPPSRRLRRVWHSVLEGGKLCIAVRTPRAAIDEDDAERSVEVLRKIHRPARPFEGTGLERSRRCEEGASETPVHRLMVHFSEKEMDCQVQLRYRDRHELGKGEDGTIDCAGSGDTRPHRLGGGRPRVGARRRGDEPRRCHERSGASKSQLYHYFANKDELLREAAALQAARVLETHKPLVELLDLLDAMRRWREAVLALNRQNGCPMGALAYQLPRSAGRARTVVADGFGNLAPADRGWARQDAGSRRACPQRQSRRHCPRRPDRRAGRLAAVEEHQVQPAARARIRYGACLCGGASKQLSLCRIAVWSTIAGLISPYCLRVIVGSRRDIGASRRLSSLRSCTIRRPSN